MKGSVIPRGVPFGQLPHAICEDLEVTNAAYRVYGQFVKLANTESRAWPGHRYLEKKLPMTRKTIAAAIRCLEDTGWLVINRDRQHHTYTVIMEQLRLPLNRGTNDAGVELTPVQKLPQTGAETTPQPGQKLPHTDTQDRQPVTDTHLAERNVGWDFLTHADGFNLPAMTKMQQRRVGKLTRELQASLDHAGIMEYGPAMQEMHLRANAWPQHFDVVMTADAFVKHFELLGKAPLKRTSADVERMRTREALTELGRSRE